MAENASSTAAIEAFRNHSVALKEAIAAAGLEDIVIECERQRLITTAVMRKLIDEMIAKATDSRAYELVDSIRRSLGYESNTVLDKFLCIIYSKCGPAGQAVSRAVAEDYGFPLQKFNLVISTSQQPSRQQATPPAPPSTTSTSSVYPEPTEKDLDELLDEVTNWESFALHLPQIKSHQIAKIKQDNPQNVNAQKRALFVKWIEVDQSASWETVLKALRKAEYNTLAHRLETTELKRVRSAVDTVDHPSQLRHRTAPAERELTNVAITKQQQQQQQQPAASEPPNTENRPPVGKKTQQPVNYCLVTAVFVLLLVVGMLLAKLFLYI